MKKEKPKSRHLITVVDTVRILTDTSSKHFTELVPSAASAGVVAPNLCLKMLQQHFFLVKIAELVVLVFIRLTKLAKKGRSLYTP